jgi:S1-C subfamily serine protease
MISSCDLITIIFDDSIPMETLNYISTEVMKSNVKINTNTYKYQAFKKVPGDKKGTGSGVIIDFDDKYAYVLTNAHVVNLDTKDSHEYKIEDFYNNTYEAELVYSSSDYDLAILKYESDSDVSYMSFADDDPKVNEIVFSIGSPLGLKNIVTVGKIMKYDSISNVDYDIIIHNAIIKEGSSGSMLINKDFELVGLNSWGFVEGEDSNDFTSGGATPIKQIIKFLEEVNP